MPQFYKGVIPIVDDFGDKHTDLSHPGGTTFGLVPRDYDKYPQTMMASPPSELKVYDPSEWDALYDEQEEKKSSLEHLFLPEPNKPAFVNLDQNGDGYCWSYSTGQAIMLRRLAMGLPMVRLNPHSVAAVIKEGRDEGGWCGLSGKFAEEKGYAVEGNGPGEWPLHSRDLRYYNDECKKQMALHKVTESWYDLTKQEWSQTMTARQLATCGFNNIPCPSDFNWWGHSVCQVRWVRIEPGSWGPLILNSWKGWGRFGLAVLRGSKATANGAIGTRAVTASAA